MESPAQKETETDRERQGQRLNGFWDKNGRKFKIRILYAYIDYNCNLVAWRQCLLTDYM